MPNYFSHDSNARNDEKLIRLRIRHKAAGYGVYFMLLEILREKKDFLCPRDYNVIAYELREDAALVKSVIEEFGLFEFTEDGKFFYSESFLDRMEKVSAARRAAANRRWHPKEEDKQQQGQPCGETAPQIRQPENYIGELLQPSVWMENILRRYGIDEKQMRSYMEDFANHCRCINKTHSSVTDAQQHFYSWLNIQITKEKKNNETTQTKRTDKRRPSNVAPAVTEAASGKF